MKFPFLLFFEVVISCEHDQLYCMCNQTDWSQRWQPGGQDHVVFTPEASCVTGVYTLRASSMVTLLKTAHLQNGNPDETNASQNTTAMLIIDRCAVSALAEALKGDSSTRASMSSDLHFWILGVAAGGPIFQWKVSKALRNSDVQEDIHLSEALKAPTRHKVALDYLQNGLKRLKQQRPDFAISIRVETFTLAESLPEAVRDPVVEILESIFPQ
jgi:hypothetical protein